MNFNSFTTSDSAMYSASVVDNTTLFIPLLLQAIGIPQNYMMYPKTLILVSLSLAKSQSLSTLSAHFIISFLSSNLSPYLLVVMDSTCLISLIHYLHLHWHWCIHSFGQFSYWVEDVWSAVFCQFKECSYSTPVGLMIFCNHLVI